MAGGIRETEAADHEAAAAHAGFPDQGEFPGGGPVGDDLHDGPGRRGQTVEAQGRGAAHEIGPWPVAVEGRREIGEGWVARVAENAEGGRGLAAGPRGVPEDAGEAEGDVGGSVVAEAGGRD